MLEAVENYLNTDNSIQKSALLFNVDRKKLSLYLKENYPNYWITKFINISNKIHSFKYDYSLVNFKNYREKIEIICPEHGNFLQEVFSHKNGNGCSKCSHKKSSIKRRKDKEHFVNISTKIHGNFYDYSKTEYIDQKTKIIITCPEHGDFEQIPDSHKHGRGCPSCAKENIGWTKTKWKLKGKDKIAKLYIIKCWNDFENFIKIGRTFNTVNKRFGSKHEMPYNWEIIKIIEDENFDKIWDKEVFYHRKFKNFKYIPEIHFEGKHECFKIEILKILQTAQE